MCGIVGYIGTKKASPILINGLLRLEYRGYDSAGISTMEKNEISLMKDMGRVKNLENIQDGQLMENLRRKTLTLIWITIKLLVLFIMEL